MNELYFKLNTNNNNLYTYINSMLKEYSILLEEINRYNYKEVYIFGLYNVNSKNKDIINYFNYKLKKFVENKNYTFININDILNNKKYFEKGSYYLNDVGYNKISQIIVENLKKY